MKQVSHPAYALAAFLLVTVGGGLLMGYWNIPGPWYAALTKPSFNPPNWVFGPVWTTLYFMIAIAGWRTFQMAPRSLAMRLWWLQLVLNFMWSPVFFTLHRLDAALVILVALLATLVAYIFESWRMGQKASAMLFVPYVAWVGYAGLLNFMLWQLN